MRYSDMIKSNKPKYVEVYESLRKAILDEDFEVGKRIPGDIELGKRFQASRPTIAKAIRRLESEGLVSRRQGSGTYVLPQRKKKKSGLFGLLVWQSRGFWGILNEAIAQTAHGSNHGIIIGNWPSGYNRMDLIRHATEMCEQFKDKKVDGVFFMPLSLPYDQAIVNTDITETFDKENIPLVLIDTDYTVYPYRSKYDLVGIDNLNAAYTLTDHLISLGYKKIGFITRGNNDYTIPARIDGYKQALIHHGIQPDPKWMYYWDFKVEGNARNIMKGDHVEAYICVNDLLAGVVMRDLIASGARIPEDVALVGIDDDITANQFFPVPLTTIHQPLEQLAEAAVSMMFSRLEDPGMRPMRFTCELVVRESCGAKIRSAARQQSE